MNGFMTDLGGGLDRNSLLASFNSGIPSYSSMTQGGSTDIWGTLIGGGLGILNNYLMGAYKQPSGFQTPVGVAAASTTAGAVIPAIIAAGGRVVGSVVRISRAAYAALPDWVKQGIVAMGLTLLISDASDGSGGLITYGGKKPRRRGKGITGAELRGFNKMTRLLRKVGMRPKALGGGSRRRCK